MLIWVSWINHLNEIYIMWNTYSFLFWKTLFIFSFSFNRCWQKMLALNRYGGAERETKRKCRINHYAKCVNSMILFALMLKKDPMRCKSKGKFCCHEIHLFVLYLPMLKIPHLFLAEIYLWRIKGCCLVICLYWESFYQMLLQKLNLICVLICPNKVVLSTLFHWTSYLIHLFCSLLCPLIIWDCLYKQTKPERKVDFISIWGLETEWPLGSPLKQPSTFNTFLNN